MAKAKIGLKVGDANYGYSQGEEQVKNSDVKSYSLSLGFGAQLVIGGEAKLI